MILELYKATLHSGNREVFANLSFLAKPGERVAITGGTAAMGGMLALQAFLGMRMLDSGWVCFDGEPVLPATAACFRKSISYLSREFDFGETTVEAVAQALFGERINKGMENSADAVCRSLEQLDVAADSLAKTFDRLDAATAQRALMALTFMFRRPVALMDNPTLWQDGNGRNLVAEYIKSSRFDDTTVIVATSDPIVLGVCDKVVDLGK